MLSPIFCLLHICYHSTGNHSSCGNQTSMKCAVWIKLWLIIHDKKKLKERKKHICDINEPVKPLTRRKRNKNGESEREGKEMSHWNASVPISNIREKQSAHHLLLTLFADLKTKKWWTAFQLQLICPVWRHSRHIREYSFRTENKNTRFWLILLCSGATKHKQVSRGFIGP